MIRKRKKWSRNLTRFWRKNRFSKAQGLWYNNKVWMAAQDGLYVTKRTNPNLELPPSTLQIEGYISFDSPQSTETGSDRNSGSTPYRLHIFRLATEY